jgi:hypothetical protein
MIRWLIRASRLWSYRAVYIESSDKVSVNVRLERSGGLNEQLDDITTQSIPILQYTVRCTYLVQGVALSLKRAKKQTNL